MTERPGGTTRFPALPGLGCSRGGRAHGHVLGTLTAWALMVPECVAYAQIAGVSPQNAFHAAPVALVSYAPLDRSRFLTVGVMSAAAVLSHATVPDASFDPRHAGGLSAAVAGPRSPTRQE
ncbi:SulP family inorganic anion transporter [Streptomyces sp. NPDC017260]|uniref:SulP family inorganic anion transporter n=1 Tax=unclassified Streptomyces TaxID=2593676 RepID=UPI00379955BA